MFGQNNNPQDQLVQDTNQPADTSVGPPAGFVSPTPTDNFAADNSAPAQDLTIPAELTQTEDDTPVPGVVDETNDSLNSSLDTLVTDAGSSPLSADGSDLLSMKQAALQQLTPLVQHLDQSPEEKFRTLMMMIQATDDQSKLQEAFETAKTITDDKVRAQALLDVINEINYFTQHQK